MYSQLSRLIKFVFTFLFIFLLIHSNTIAQSQITGTIRAIHMGGNWGRNAIQIPVQPEDYYSYLERLNVNWVGISVALHIDNSLDDTIEKNYDDNLTVPTFRDEPLRAAIRGFKQRNINVYITIGIETQQAAQSEYPVNRTQLGDPFAFNTDPNILPENWPWNPGHVNYQQFVQNFWNSFAVEAKYLARIAEEEGIGLFSLGAETDKLFRTRSGGPFPNHFLNEIKAAVDSVRSVFTGLVTYEIHWGALADPATFGPGSDYLFQDLGLDAVGVSAYFKLAEPEPTTVVPVSDLEVKWRNIFNDFLTPLKNRNPNLPILFLEFGYVDAVGSLYNAVIDEFINRVFKDNNGNGLDDGEEQQANAHESFYKVNEEFNRLVQGTFLWGNDISSEADWNNSFGNMRTFSIRNKLAESIVAEWYQLYKPDIAVPQLVSPENSAVSIPINTELKWYSSANANSYNIRISDTDDFSNIVLNPPALNDTVFTIENLSYATIYYWQVRALTSEGNSNWSETFSFTTEDEPFIPLEAPVLIYPENGAINISTELELKWFGSINADIYTARVSDKDDLSNIIFNSTSLNDTIFSLENLLYNTTYYWQVNALNSNGMSGWSDAFSFTTEMPTSISENIPFVFNLEQNYPNPFNPTTKIKFTVAESKSPSPYEGEGFGVRSVTLKVYDILGNEISTLINKALPAGNYEVIFDGRKLNSGVFIYQLLSGEYKSTKKMVLIK